MTPSYDQYRLGSCLFEEKPVAAPQLTASSTFTLPERIDLRPQCAPVEDQGSIGSCAANAVVGAMEYFQIRAGHAVTDLSRLFVYYNARKLADKEKEDAGTFIHHAMASVLAYGACPESMWPYQKSLWAEKPVQACYDAALEFEAVSYARTPLGPDCKSALAREIPVVFGACLPSRMLQVEAAETGRVRVPVGGWPQPGGGHAMLIVGYDDADQTWLIRNSWGAGWGDGGYAKIPYAVMERYGMPTQFWVIGALERAEGLQVSGTSVAESQSSVMSAAPTQVATGLDLLRGGVRAQLEQNLADAKAGFRERLRGPGAGGGY